MCVCRPRPAAGAWGDAEAEGGGGPAAGRAQGQSAGNRHRLQGGGGGKSNTDCLMWRALRNATLMHGIGFTCPPDMMEPIAMVWRGEGSKNWRWLDNLSAFSRTEWKLFAVSCACDHSELLESSRAPECGSKRSNQKPVSGTKKPLHDKCFYTFFQNTYSLLHQLTHAWICRRLIESWFQSFPWLM